MADAYHSLDFTPDFLEDLVSRRFSQQHRDRIVRALQLLDENEKHPSLRVHAMRGDQAGIWSASASDELRITFRRLTDGRKLLLTCSHHYDR